jgi:hypothetical protein
MIRSPVILLATAAAALAGPYPGPPNTQGTSSDAIHMDSALFVSWAKGHLDYDWGTNVSSSWRTPAKAYGKATGDVFDIVCLGDNGTITMFFPHPIKDGAGADFAVFENSFSITPTGFFELAFVEVSSDGVNFFRFPSDSLTPAATNAIDPTNVSGLAGKYPAGYGTPFDLAALEASPFLDKGNIRFVRLIDIFGNGSAKDSSGDPIYDPYPNTGSAGFDLDAIGVIHQNDGDFQMLRALPVGGSFEIEWQSNPGTSYRVEHSIGSLGNWQQVQILPGRTDRGSTIVTAPVPAGEAVCFWRVVALD